ncbi:glycosyltransferase [Flavobacterium sp.]|uniref:glycosyltransferase n=1 Tax=Flavobacterium sp. TaxID=239 RepID=UPI0025E2A4DC|nr:glycosyltransferase [Flavobacterium sp.]
MIKNLQLRNKNTSKAKFNSSQQSPQEYDMVVFCHLRWEFVYQRPQHLISRMAQTKKVLFIEEPLNYNNDESGSLGNLITINENLHILQPKVKDIEAIARIIPRFIKSKSIGVGWFYSPAFSPLLNAFNFDTVVYDCMDELSLFKGAPSFIIQAEKYLMANADIVFTGGKSLYESKKELHYNVHCFPSSVDTQHFSQDVNAMDIPADIANIKKPIVGYFGVIDERIDVQLLQNIALARPDVSFVMIGPLAKIEDKDLPKETNIYYLGMKKYSELPLYLKAFDIAMMPFALNDATKYISPTKTLEYMAAGKPIISTRIKDVERDYKSCVHLVETSAQFSDAITAISGVENNLMLQCQYTDILRQTSWDATVEKMSKILKDFAL